MRKRNLTDLLIYVITAELTGVLSAIFTGSFTDFFDKYQEPPLLPPSWLFPVVWVILYGLMGISAYLVSVSDVAEEKRKSALKIYFAQLFVNFTWSIIFFRFELLWVAVGVIILLWILIIAMIVKFYKINPTAAKINIPYLLWVTFAAYLNIAIAVIN